MEPTGAEQRASASTQQVEPTGAEEGASVPSQQTLSAEVYALALAPQPEPIGAEAQRLVPMGAEEGVPLQAQHAMSAEEGVPMEAQHPEPTSSTLAVGVTPSMSAPPNLETLPSHQSPLSPMGIRDSSSGCRSDLMSKTTENEASGSVPSSRTLRPHPGTQIKSISTDAVSEHSGTLHEQAHGSSSGCATANCKNSVTSSSSMSLNCSTSSGSSRSDPTKPNILDSRDSSILDVDDDEMDDSASLKPLMDMVDVYSDYYDQVERKQNEEYIIANIKSCVRLASIWSAKLTDHAAKVFGDAGQRAVPTHAMDEEVERLQWCASLERRVEAVRDYVTYATDDTTEEAIKDLINAYDEFKMESNRSPDRSGSANRAACSSDCQDIVAQEGGVSPDGERSRDAQGASGVAKQEIPLEGQPDEKTSSEVVKQEIDAPPQAPVETKSESIVGAEQPSEASGASWSASSDRDHKESVLPSDFARAAVLKISSMTEGRVCEIRTMNSVMLNCMRTVASTVQQALEASRVAQRAKSLAARLRSSGTTGDHVAALEYAATATVQCAEMAVLEIEDAVRLHEQVVCALQMAEKALHNMKRERCCGPQLILHLALGVGLIELQVSHACKTYLDGEADKSSSGPPTSRVLRAVIDKFDPAKTMPFKDIEHGPSDVLQALSWASHSSANALDMIVRALYDFWIASLRKRCDSE